VWPGASPADASPPDEDDAGANDLGAPDALDPALRESEWQPLLDATLSQWYRFLPSTGRDADPSGVFKVEGEVLHVLGNEPPTGDQDIWLQRL
jgi:hypothetical protein